MLLDRRRAALLTALVTLLLAVYLFTYSGQIESGDTRLFVDAVGSIAQFGDTLLDVTAWANEPLPTTPVSRYPLLPADIEPLQLVIPAPLFWLAARAPGVGLIHTVWLFNMLMCAMACALLFLYALALGYDERLALLAALALGLLTILWVYSRTFFREPLACCFILAAGLLIERWRARQYRSFVLPLLALLMVAGGLLTKEATILALPGLTLLAIPVPRLSARQADRLHRAVGIGVLVVLVAVILFALLSALSISRDFTALYTVVGALVGRNAEFARTMHTALHSYLLSIGGSVWGTSPIALLALPGLWLLYQRRQYRYLLVVPMIAAGFMLGYALLRGVHWFGGLSWPPRFLLPVVPYLLIAALPALEWVLRALRPAPIQTSSPNRTVWPAISVGVLALYSLWVQLSGVTLPWGAYNAALPPEANGLGEWGGGLNTVQYLRWVLLPQTWGAQHFDFAWVRNDAPLWPLLCIALAAASAFALRRALAGREGRWVAGLPVALLIVVMLCLRAIYADPLYHGDRQALREMLAIIQANAQPDDVLLLANNNLEPFFLNYGKFSHPRVVSLPDQPGEQPSPEQPAQISSVNPDALLVKTSIPLIHNLAATRERLWLLADSGPWIPWSVRPVERFLVTHYYPVREIETDPTVRLIEYSTARAPDPALPRGPQYLSDLRYGDVINLLGVELPNGLRYRPGDLLPVSLYWQARAPLNVNYTVALFLAAQDGTVIVQGMDTQPAWGFAPTSIWVAGVPLWDNRALRLPPDALAGRYRLWVRLYQSDAPDNMLPVVGTETRERSIGVLPVDIDIQP